MPALTCTVSFAKFLTLEVLVCIKGIEIRRRYPGRDIFQALTDLGNQAWILKAEENTRFHPKDLEE